MKNRLCTLFALFFFLLYFCGKNSVAQSKEIPTLSFSGEWPDPFALNLAELKAMPQTEVKGRDRDGEMHSFQGVLLRDLLKRAKMEFGTGLKGKSQAQYLLAEAADGYKVIFSLPEIDPEFSGKEILVAHSRDGIPLEDGVGPFRFVVPEEKLHARWIRDVVSVKLIKLD
ncbi:molybdopterin-dependent oxidoreductase [Pararhodonellum marinum]|uniref:molybdopterin-dependent oxidoreductase n=1 Tax=Pararhodonellum marinum TaxID=2755358 RepID=UPI0018902ED1|nr:molybdopterin-dependent oxidoreductase [Pararhodonellum marinum]